MHILHTFSLLLSGTMSNSTSAPLVYPSPSPQEEEEAEPLIGYPAIATTVDGQPVFAYLPPPLPPFRPRRRCCSRRRCATSCACFSLVLLAVAAVAAFFVWPRSLEMTVMDLHLGNIHFNVVKGLIPQVFLTITLDVRLRVRNPNFFGVTYDTVTVSILFEGDEIGDLQSQGDDFQARSTSYVDATLDLNSYQIASNVLLLVAALDNGALPLQTVTVLNGHINVLWFELPLQGMVSCNLVVDPQEQVLISQDCDG